MVAMSTRISDTVFSGDASNKLTTADAYIANKSATKVMSDALASGTATSTQGVATQGSSVFGSAKDVLSQSSTVNKVGDSIKAGQGVGPTDILGSIKGEVKDSTFYQGLEKRAKEAKEKIGGAFPFELSQACKDIIEMFAYGLLGGRSGYDLVRGGNSHFIASTAVQCALDAFGMLASIPGMKGKLKNEVIDVEATSMVLSGLIGTLVEFGMHDDIEEVLKLSPSTLAVNQAVGMSSGKIIEKGNINTIGWMVDKMGSDYILSYNSNAVNDIVRKYDTSQSPNTPPEYFIETLAKLNPNWANAGEIYYLTAFDGASPSAMKAFEQHPALNAISMTAPVEFFTPPGAGYPSPVDVTRNLYPLAVGVEDFIPNQGDFA